MTETLTKRWTQVIYIMSSLLVTSLTACGGGSSNNNQNTILSAQSSDSPADSSEKTTRLQNLSSKVDSISELNQPSKQTKLATQTSENEAVLAGNHHANEVLTVKASQATQLSLDITEVTRVVATDATGLSTSSPSVTSWLNSASAEGAVSVTHNAPDRLPIGKSEVTFTAIDAQGNRIQKTAVIFVVQVIAPVEPAPPLPPLTIKMRPMIDTSFIPSSSQKPYTLELSRWNIKNNGDTSYAVANTDSMQRAIDWASENGYDSIKVPAGNYLIGKYGNAVYQAGIKLPSNMVFELDKDATIEMHTNDKWNYCLIDIREQKNVVIRGGSLKGDRDSHIFTPRDSDGKAGHDEGHLICVQHESENVLIENMKLTHATGDGILLVGHKGAGSFVNNIIIRNNDFNNNRRQGVSVVGGQKVLIEDNEIHHMNGVSPQFGIDIESGIYTSADIIIRRNNFHHNRGGDIVNTDGANVWIENNTMHQGEGNTYIDGPIVWHRNVDMSILNNEITMLTTSVNWWWGMISYAKEFSTRNTATTYIENNTCNGCGIYTRYHHGLVLRNNKVSKRPVLIHYIKNMKLEDNKLTGGASWFDAEYRLKQVSGSASGNTLDGILQDIKLSDTPTNHNIDGAYWK